MKNLLISAAMALLITLTGCSTFPRDAAWETPGSDKQIRVELSKLNDGQGMFQITTKALPGAKIKGVAKAVDTTFEFTFTAMEYLGNWSEGWTEATWTMTGSATLVQGENGWILKAQSIPTLEAPTQAAIRLHGTYFNGGKALSLLTNRWDRIQSAVDFLKTRQNTWDPQAISKLFFPEVYGYEKEPAPGFETAYGESITWNRFYTAGTFPPILADVRNSGTLLRDFEEGRPLWQLSYNWNEFWGHFCAAAVFQSVK